MKQLDGPLELNPEQVIEAEQKKEYSFLGSMTLKRGHKLFAVDTFDFTVKEIQLKGKVVYVDAQGKKHFSKCKVHIEKDCWYTGALNKVNAFRKFLVAFSDRINLADLSDAIYQSCQQDQAKILERQWQFDVIDKLLKKH